MLSFSCNFTLQFFPICSCWRCCPLFLPINQGPFELRDTLPLEDWNFDGLVEHIAKARKMMPVPPLGNSTAIKEDAVELPPVGNLVTATVE